MTLTAPITNISSDPKPEATTAMTLIRRIQATFRSIFSSCKLRPPKLSETRPPPAAGARPIRPRPTKDLSPAAYPSFAFCQAA